MAAVYRGSRAIQPLARPGSLAIEVDEVGSTNLAAYSEVVKTFRFKAWISLTGPPERRRRCRLLYQIRPTNLMGGREGRR